MTLTLVSMTDKGAMHHHSIGWGNILNKQDVFSNPIEFIYRKDNSIWGWFLRIFRLIHRSGLRTFFFINGEYNPILLVTLIIFRILRVQTVVTWHDVSPHPGSVFNYFYWFVSFLNARIANSVLVHNRNYVNSIFLYKKKVTYLPLPPLKISNQVINLKEKDGSILFIGRIEDYKGLDRLINLYTLIGNRLRPLIIIGSGGDVFQESLGESGVKNVTFLGPLADEDASFYMRKATAMIMPYKHCSQSINPYWASCYKMALIVSLEVSNALSLDSVAGCYLAEDTDGYSNLLSTNSKLKPINMDTSAEMHLGYIARLLGVSSDNPYR